MNRKHQLKKNGKIKFTTRINVEPTAHFFYIYRCIHCNKALCLEEFQVKDLPTDLAKCESELAPRMKLLERITGSVDCLLRKKKGNKNGS